MISLLDKRCSVRFTSNPCPGVISKKEAIALFSSAKELAKALGISKAAVSQWPDGPIPDNHDLRIRYELKPEHFRPNPAAGVPMDMAVGNSSRGAYERIRGSGGQARTGGEDPLLGAGHPQGQQHLRPR